MNPQKKYFMVSKPKLESLFGFAVIRCYPLGPQLGPFIPVKSDFQSFNRRGTQIHAEKV